MLNSKDKEKFEVIKLLINTLSEESKLFWVRFNIYLAINTASLGFIFNLLNKNQNNSIYLLLSIAIFGISICTIWYLVSSRGRDLYRHWYEDAREIAYTSENLTTLFNKSLMMEDFIKQKQQKPSNHLKSVTKLSIVLIFIYASLWILIPLYFYVYPPQLDKSNPNKSILNSTIINNEYLDNTINKNEQTTNSTNNNSNIDKNRK